MYRNIKMATSTLNPYATSFVPNNMTFEGIEISQRFPTKSECLRGLTPVLMPFTTNELDELDGAIDEFIEDLDERLDSIQVEINDIESHISANGDTYIPCF